MDPIINITVTFPSQEEAQRIGNLILSQKLAASTQISGPIHSNYWWRGALHDADEWIMAIKATATNFEVIKTLIEEHHPYELAEIYATPLVAVGDAYREWVQKHSRGTTKDG